MAQYWTDFSEYTIGLTPADWTLFWHNINITLSIEVGDIGGKLLYADTTSQERFAWAWDVPGSVSRVQTLCRVKSVTSDTFLIGPATSIAGGSTSETGYRLTTDIEKNEIVLRRFLNGSGSSDLATYSFPQSINTYYWIKKDVNSGVINAKIWADGDDEPEDWQLNYTDPSPLPAGAVGLGTFSRDGYCDFFSVGTNGDVAPNPPVATPIMNPTSGGYPSGTTVAITCSTPSSTIYYTTDGSIPTIGSSVYSSPIEITDGMNIKAFATASDLTDSEIASETYTVSEVTEIQQPIIFIIT